MDFLMIFALMCVCLLVVVFVCAISENRRMKQGKPSRYPESRIMIIRRIDRRK